MAITDHVHMRAFQTLYCICTCNNANALMQIHSDTGRHVQVCGLTKGLEHKFRVAAVNQAGQGPFVTSQIIKVNEPSKYTVFQ